METGELYDMEKDPDETVNLFHSAAHQKTLHHMRQLLLDWLLTERRHRTVNPSKPGHKMGHHHYLQAGDR
ncbi:MAG: hypothetical protein Fur0032_08180 [Terrimicrobiaceae bacterium]